MLAVLAFSACSSNSDESSGQQFWNVTLQASMDDAATRALSEGTDNAITASFAENDEVVVVDADGVTIVGTLKAQTAGASTTLTGTLNASSLEVNEVVTLRYRSATANYDGQVGTLAGISTGQDYAEGTLTVSATTPLTFTSNSVTLDAMQSITKFSFKDASTNATVSVKTFGIAAVDLVQSIAANGDPTIGAVTGTLASPSTSVYVALRNNSGEKQTYSFTVKDDDGNWYLGTKKANLATGKNYTATVTLTKLPALTSSDAVGTIGVVGGLPAIVVDINSTKKAVALMNVGALCPEAYGAYYTYANRASGLTNEWYVPEQSELDALVAKSNAWGAPNGVNGRTFTIGSNSLFLPAAGFIDNDEGQQTAYSGKVLVSTFGYYWSQTEVTPSGSLAYSYQFSTSINDTYSEYEVNDLTVRPFHALD
jgi:hypothetical protein